ncbi:class I SAM-dependent methyltransferase [Janthinobacterium agaricidamnosum]|uniref:Methyltransferase domain protein n=1 Tax=Janthinobacterium agaricidamnosum NBRC 102515 = DSM 9628 TaxID=1349767 RepID=W0V3U9_9BURK|nr:class I SAM-dependent methyltransferase [Janthinobacterium agaricidamnosum]CDG82023.1 methyltransferase domain protein [Janthinobacterium agaricidamnosum NBRC 102515 = DSM 9628]
MKPEVARSAPLDTSAGAAIYSSFVLKLYDAWVLGVSNRWAWLCPTASVLLPFYREHAGQRHLDVGVGTGFYLARSNFPQGQEVSLLDLNENSLRAAARRMGRPNSGLYVADVMQPVAALDGQQYDSIALFYLLHCLPGNMSDKASVFANLKPHLAAGGVLYGATIIGDSAGHNGLGRKLMKVYNGKGIFGNRNDTVESLTAALRLHFSKVQIKLVGKVALFSARGPIA